MKSDLSLSLKRRIYNQYILSVLTCGSQIWSLTKFQERKLQSAQRGVEIIMIGITWRDRKRALWIREQTEIEHILTTIKRKKVDMSRTHHAPKKITDGQLKQPNGNPGMVKEGKADRELDGEMR